MSRSLRQAAGLALLGLALLLVGLSGGRDTAFGGAMYGIGFLLLLAAVIAGAVVLLRGDKARDGGP